MAESDHGHQAVYDASATAWDAERAGCFPERALIEAATKGLTAGAAVLDLGCGSGAPISVWLTGQGFRVTGVDFSQAMLGLARARLPGAEFLHVDMRGLDLGRRFDAIIAWDSLFHLTAPEQLALLPRLAAHLHPGGRLLFTCGPEASEVWGRVAGGPVYHASLSPAGYAQALEGAGLLPLRFAADDRDFAGRSYWLARRSGAAPDQSSPSSRR